MAFETESKYFFLNTDKTTVERFDMSKFLLFDEDVFDPVTSNAFDTIRKLKLGGRYKVEGKDARPDLVSQDIYGTTQYWWVILLYNELQSYTEIVHAQELIYPSIGALEDFYFNLKVQQNKSDRDT